ncbi:methyltransferase domain-containing protein [Colletotrichum incanum]|nr:methyltransferase domain-containing protein [Colletotrichum incanum]
MDPNTIRKAFSETKNITDYIVAETGFIGYLEFIHPQHEELCCILIIEALRKLRCDLWRAKAGQCLRPVRVVASARNQFSRCCLLLHRAGLAELIVSGDLLRTNKPISSKTSAEIAVQLVEQYPSFKGLTSLIKHTGNHLAEIWSDRTDGVRVIFGTSEGKKLVEEVYGSDCTSKAFHRLLENFLERLLDRLSVGAPPLRKLRVLELGAGTGGTTKWLAPLLRAHIPEGAVEYLFTDIAGTLVSQAEQSFGKEYGFMSFFTHNIENPPPSKLAGTQSLIIVVNVVHATTDIVQSLRNIRQYLRPDGGLVLMLEIMERTCWADFVFGFFEGWWRFNDGRTHALAPLSEWEQAFLEAGFAHVDWTEGSCADSGFQRLFLGSVV